MQSPSHQPDPHEAAAESRSPLTRIVRNSTLNALGMALIVPLNFIALFTMAQRLGAEAMGVYFSLFAISAVIHWISDAGTSTVLTRRVARSPERLSEIVSESMGIMLVVMTTSTLLFIVASLGWTWVMLGTAPWSLMLAAAAAMVARHAVDFASNTFRGLERFEFENLVRVIQSASFCVLIWYAVQPDENGILNAYLAYTVSNLLATLIVWGFLLAGWCCPLPQLSIRTIRQWYTESMPLGVGDVVRQLFIQIDTLLLATLASPVAVGLYSIASRPLQPLRLVPRTIVSVTFPMMSRAAHLERYAMSQMFAKTTNLLWVASLPICIATTVCARPLVLKTAGPGYVGAIGPLQLLIWATVLTFVNAQLRFAFTALDAESKYWRLSIGSLLIKVPICIIFILLFGVYGACFSVLLGELVVTTWGLAILKAMDVTGPSWTQLLRALPAGLAMYATLSPFVSDNATLWWMAVGLAVSGIVYLLVSLLTGAWPREDAQMFQQAFRASFGGVARRLVPTGRS